MDQDQKISNLFSSQWPYLSLLGLLALLTIWILIPGNLVKSANKNLDGKVALLEEKKQSLINQNAKLDSAMATAVCEGEKLTLPDGEDIEDLLPSPLPVKPNRNKVVDKLEKSTVLILNASGAGGSGFFISRDLILTNAHVAGNDDSFMVGNSKTGLVEATLVAKGDERYIKDFSVLKVSEKIGVPLKFKIYKENENVKLTRVIASGYPGVVTGAEMQSSSAFPDMTITQGEISSQQRIEGQTGSYFHSAKISQGNSGGPLTDACGDVLGINTFGVDAEVGNVTYFVALKSADIYSFLQSLQIEPNISEEECKD